MTGVPPLTRDAADAALADADAAISDASASLVALEEHRGHALLRTWPLSGLSARRWNETAETVAELHADLARYRDVVARAHTARGTRARPSEQALAEVAELLTGPSIHLGTELVPLQRRGLLGAGEVSSHIRPPELLERMSAAFDAATVVVARAEAVWDALAERLDPLDAVCADLVAVGVPGSREVGVPTPAEVREQLTDLRRIAMADPLSVDPAEPVDPGRLAAVRASLDILVRRRDALVALRTNSAERLAALDATLDALAAGEDAAADSAVRVARAVAIGAGSRLPSPVRRVGPLRRRRDAIGADLGAGRWAAALDAVVALESDVADARRRSDDDRAVLDGLLERRAELRGRLGALAAKAAARGRAEDLDLDALHRDAQALLWNAPCDLAAATVAVRRYQRALDEPPASTWAAGSER